MDTFAQKKFCLAYPKFIKFSDSFRTENVTKALPIFGVYPKIRH